MKELSKTANGEIHSNGGNGDNSNGTVSNGMIIDKKEEPRIDKHGLPEIPHISNNIIPLSNILKFYTQEAYKQLNTLIENLAVTVESESDVNRKKSFLKLIISLREDFIKVYTLTKWASNSKDISKLIDLLNWFRMQEFHFEKLSFQLNSLNSFSGAKLPNSDILTSLEVLINGRPSLPSYNFIKTPKISNTKILQVLQDLNLILSTRMALNDNIPKRFINNYTIKDGRIYFTIPNEFQVSITVANDLIIDSDADYHQSPYYFVDFAFLFGLNPETSLITHRDNNIITRLPKKSHEKLEKVVNNILLNSKLNGLYDLLHKYSISFKLYLIAKQLRDICINSKWRNNIQFNYQNGKSLIIINYWCGQYLSKNWKSFIELGIDKSYNLNFRWFRNGKYILNHGITGLWSKDFSEKAIEDDEEEAGDLSVDLILNIIVNKHSEILMKKIHDELNHRFKTLNQSDGEDQEKHSDNEIENNINDDENNSDQICSYITSHQLVIKLSPNKSTIFAINPLTGLFYFIDPTPIQEQITKNINKQPINIKNNNFVSENDMINNILNNLIQLRLQVFNMEINNKLITTGWINNAIIKLNEYETGKLFNFLINNNETATKIQFYRRKNWPSSWFLIDLITGTLSTTYWWVARIRSIKGEWKIQWMQKLQFNMNTPSDSTALDKSYQMINSGVEPYYLNYEFFNSLSSICSNMILDHMILEELQIRNIKYIKPDSIETVLERFGIAEIPEDEIKLENSRDKTMSYETTIMIYNNNELLPIAISSTSLFLKIKLTNSLGSTQMKIKLFGKLALSKISFDNLNELNLKFNDELKGFEINDLINLDTKLNTVNDTPTHDFDFGNSKHHLLDNVFNNLNKLNKLIKILDQLNKNNVEVINNSITQIIIKIDDNLNNMIIKLPETPQDSIKLIGENLSGEFNLILSYLNDYLTSNNNEDNNKTVIIGIIIYLKQINPIIKAIEFIRKSFNKIENIYKISNGLKILNFDVKIPSIDLLQFIYHFNYTIPTSKKIQKDTLIIDLSFKNNKFATINNPLIKLLMKNNWNNKNAKYKTLFESIYRSINEFNNSPRKSSTNIEPLQVRTPSSTNEDIKYSPTIMKLDRDFLINPMITEKLLIKINDCFLFYLSNENKNN